MFPNPALHSTVGPGPTAMTCPYCRTNITTAIQNLASNKTHMIFCIMCFFGFALCAPFVYCSDSCLAKKHTCPNCHKFLGMFDD